MKMKFQKSFLAAKVCWNTVDFKNHFLYVEIRRKYAAQTIMVRLRRYMGT